MQGSGNECCKLCNNKPRHKAKSIGRSIASTARSFVPTSMPLGQKGDQNQEALGKSQGGFSTKLHLRAEGKGKPMTLVLSAGQRHETTRFEALMEQGAVKRVGRGRPKLRPKRVLGDKAYSSRKIRHYLKQRGIGYTIPRRIDETRTGPFNRALYQERNYVERAINRLKQFRRVATRYEKRAVNFLAMATLATIMLWL